MRAKLKAVQHKNLEYRSKLETVSPWEELLDEITADDFKCLCDKFLPSAASRFVKLQVDLNIKKPQGRRFTKEFLELAVKLYFMGPKAYRSLSTIFTLPSKDRKISNCSECGSSHGYAKSPAYGKACSMCHQLNYFAWVCKNKKQK